MTNIDLYLFDDNTSKARGLCLLENTPTSEGRPAGTDDGRQAGVPCPSGPAVAARSCAGLEWIRHR